MFIYLIGSVPRETKTTTTTITQTIPTQTLPTQSNQLTWESKKMSMKTKDFYAPYNNNTHYITACMPSWIYATGFSRTYDETYFVVESYFHVQKSDGTYEYIFIPNVNCTSDIIKMNNSTLYNSFNFTSFICPNITSVELWGDNWGADYRVLEVYVSRCSGLVTCQTSSAITSYITGFTSYFLTLNSYYDESDSDNPIKQYLDYHKNINHANSYRADLQVYIEGTEVTFLNGTKKTIFETGTIHSDTQYFSSKYLAKITMFLSQKRYKIQEYNNYTPKFTTRMLDSNTSSTNSTEKVVKEESNPKYINLLRFLAEIGGFLYLIKTVFGAVSAFFSNTLMRMSLINEIKTKVSNTKVNRSNLYNQIDFRKMNARPLGIIEEEQKNPKYDDNFDDQAKSGVNQDYNQLEEFEDNKVDEFSSFGAVSQSEVISRITYSFKDLIYYLFCCIKCNKKRNSAKQNTLNFRYQSYKKDKEVLKLIMDATNLMTTIKEMKSAIRSLRMQINQNKRDIQPRSDSKLENEPEEKFENQKSLNISENIGYPIINKNIANVKNTSIVCRKENYEISSNSKELDKSQSKSYQSEFKEYSINKDNDYDGNEQKSSNKDKSGHISNQVEDIVEMSNHEAKPDSLEISKRIQQMERSFSMNDESLEVQSLYKINVLQDQKNSQFYPEVFNDEDQL